MLSRCFSSRRLFASREYSQYWTRTGPFPFCGWRSKANRSQSDHRSRNLTEWPRRLSGVTFGLPLVPSNPSNLISSRCRRTANPLSLSRHIFARARWNSSSAVRHSSNSRYGCSRMAFTASRIFSWRSPPLRKRCWATRCTRCFKAVSADTFHSPRSVRARYGKALLRRWRELQPAIDCIARLARDVPAGLVLRYEPLPSSALDPVPGVEAVAKPSAPLIVAIPRASQTAGRAAHAAGLDAAQDALPKVPLGTPAPLPLSSRLPPP